MLGDANQGFSFDRHPGALWDVIDNKWKICRISYRFEMLDKSLLRRAVVVRADRHHRVGTNF